jgi:hypothetical protein
MICQPEDLSPKQIAALEILLGRRVLPSETVGLRIFELAPNCPQRRAEVAGDLRRYFAEVDASRQPVSEQDVENIINEAMTSVRPSYRSLP